MNASWQGAALLAAIATLLACSGVAAAERALMPAGAFVCKDIAPAVEHARIVRQPSSAGIRPFVEAEVGRGACRVIQSETNVDVVDVDGRGFALIVDGPSGRWWTDAETVWGYFDARAKVKAWKKP